MNDTKQATEYRVLRDGLLQASFATELQAYNYIHSHTSSSVHHATTYEGWMIALVEL